MTDRFFHEKFFRYWQGLNQPPLESRLPYRGQNWQPAKPPLFNLCQYRLLGDRHWQLRRLWIDMSFKMDIESRHSLGGAWKLDLQPQWLPELDYRIAGAPAPHFQPRKHELLAAIPTKVRA